jgi:hypothetical protein
LEVGITGHNFERVRVRVRPFHQSLVAIGPVVSEEKIRHSFNIEPYGSMGFE